VKPTRDQTSTLASITGVLVEPFEVTDVLARMLAGTTTALDAQAAGLLVTNAQGELEMLAATSHESGELEIYQAQTGEGPCTDAVRQRRPVTARGRGELASRWPAVGPAIVDAGFLAVHAQPMRWHGRVLGGLNLFFDTASEPSEHALVLAQVFADVATLALVQTQAPSDRELGAHVQEALDARTLVEQAKGVIIETDGVDPAEAYVRLLAMSAQQELSVTELARSLVWQARSG
jgi:hypothetical protein